MLGKTVCDSSRRDMNKRHTADGYARDRKTGVILSHLGPGLTNAATGVANAALDSIDGHHCGDIQSYFYGRHHIRSSTSQRCQPGGDLSSVLQAGVSRGSRQDLPRPSARSIWRSQARPGSRRHSDGQFSADLDVNAFKPYADRAPGLDPETAERS
jgi:acetolactate synthase-1/2/3 large subunit